MGHRDVDTTRGARGGTTGKRPRLGAILVAAKAITENQLQAALAFQQKSNLRLGDALLQLRLTTEREIKQAIATQLNVPFLDLEAFTPAGGPDLAQVIPREYAEKHRVLPMGRLGQSLTVAMDDPTDTAVIVELQQLTGCTINVVTCTRHGFLRALSRTYGASVRVDPRVATGDAFGRG